MRRPWVAASSVLLTLLLVFSCRAAPEPTATSPETAERDASPLSFRMGRPDVVLLITGGTNGMLEPCHCAGAMDGGFARRSGLVSEYRRAFGRVLLIDLGDSFVPDRPSSLRNAYAIRSFRALGYDAVVLGDQEWAAPNPLLEEVLAEGGSTFLSTTVSSREAPDLPLSSELKTRWGARELTLFSENHDHEFRFMPNAKRDELDFVPLSELAAKTKASQSAGQVVIVAVHGDNLQLAETARSVPADLLLWGNTMRSDRQMQRVAGTPVVKVGGDREVGVVALRFGEEGLAEMEYRVERLDGRWPFDVSLMRLYEQYMAEAMPGALAETRKEALAWVDPAKCGACHPAAYDKWAKSRHAHAYETLVREGRAGDPDCVACHTTGFRTQGGFTTPERTPHLAGVGCQVCHPVEMAPHVEQGVMPRRLDEASCRTCHTEVNDPGYAHGKRWADARCPDGSLESGHGLTPR